nr:hypothetical protein [Tanacetum cinerariifolium]
MESKHTNTTQYKTQPDALDTTYTRLKIHLFRRSWLIKEHYMKHGGIIAKIDADKDVTLEEVDAEKNAEVAEKDVVVQGRLEESQAQVYHIDLEHANKVLKVVTDAATSITAALSAARRRKGVVIRDPEETATPSTIVHFDPKSKDKGKCKSYDDVRPIFEKHFNSIVGFLKKSEKQLEEEASRALKRKSESSEQQAVKKQKFDKKVEELKKHLQIVLNDEDDVYTKATPLALKRKLGDYMENSSRKIASSKPKNFSDDFLLTTLKAMFEKPDVEAHIWKNQRGIHERRYPLTRFTLDWMLNNVRLEVKEESEVLLELLRFVRRQQQEGYRPDFGVDDVEDFKEFTLRDYYCWLKTYCYWYKLKLLDNVANSRLRLLEQSAAVDVKMKK